MNIAQIALPEFPLLLAPMEDVSDPPFRAVCKELGADLMYTEFISSEGLIRDAWKSRQKLDIFDYERPIGIQLFGGDTDSMVEAARIAASVGPDLIDINYGCPVKKVVCKGAGAGILKDVPKMVEMTAQIVRVVGEEFGLPVTVKTRLGWDEDSINIMETALRLQDVGIKALSIHARTRAQLYKGSADWSWIHKVKSHPDIEIPIFGNGDVDSPEKAVFNRKTYGVDGIMIGRAAIGYPWIFRDIKHYMATGELLPLPTVEERVRICRRHLEESVKWKGDFKGIVEMRRHYANYFKGLAGFKPYRMQLVMANSLDEANAHLDEILAKADTFELAHTDERPVVQVYEGLDG